MNSARRGSIYVIVMATALIVLVLGVGAIAANKADAAARVAMRDEVFARRLAAAAAELAIQRAQNTPAWRSAAASPLFTDLPLGRGFLSASVTDPVDGNLTNNTTDPVLITATGRLGTARQVFSVTATPRPVYAGCLAGVMHCGGNMLITSANVHSFSPIGANGTVTASSATVKADVYAASTISGTTYSGTNSASQAAKGMPDADVIAQYTAIATPISYSALSTGRLRRILLSGATNPFGAVNARGVYSIDCGGSALDIQDCRITGTLVITNTSGVTVSNSNYMSPWESGLPILLVSGGLGINTLSLDLVESGFQNFNPAGNPYNGVTDSDTADRYPSMLQGIVYATGDVVLAQKVTVVGALVAGGRITVNSGAVVALTRQVTGSPPGFVTRAFQVDSTTWARSIN